jgi:transglutaminase-like putative cysteine protease
VERTLDAEGDTLRRLTAGRGGLTLELTGLVQNCGVLDDDDPNAQLVPVARLSPDVLPYNRRYCETDLVSDFAWRAFGSIRGGCAKVQAVCDYVHNRLRFSYPSLTRTTAQGIDEPVGVCCDFTVTLPQHLGPILQHCSGYLGDIGVPPDPAPMDFNAWFVAYISGRWFVERGSSGSRQAG